jgi:hypothetical protein
MDYRFKESVRVISFPKGFEEEDRGLKGCCDCKQLVLAHPSDTETWKNDLTGIYVKKSEPGDVVTFSMEDANGLVVSNQGEAAIFPNDTLAVGFIYNWQDVLNTHGVGCYTIKVNFTIAGIVGGYTWGLYDLRQYSISSAKGTVRIRSKFNTFWQKLQIDFTNSNFTDSVRFNGFFGNRQPKTEINNLIGKSRTIEKATRENLNEYTLETDPISICITRQLIDFHLLNEDECFITDHNSSNHDYLLFDTPVSVSGSSEVDYIKRSRLANVKATFGDRKLLDKNYYRQN